MFWRAKQMAEKMRLALRTDGDAAKRLFQRVHNKRTQDQRAGRGDFSEGNIIYKWLLHEGLFDELRNIGVYIAKHGDSKLDLWQNPNEEMLKTLMIPFWNGRTPQEVAEGWQGAVPSVSDEVILEAVVKAYNAWQVLKEESDRQADEIRRQLDEHFAKPPPRMFRWAWFEGKVLAYESGQPDSDQWQLTPVHEEMIDKLGVPYEALMEHDMGDLQQARADDVYLGYVELMENGEYEFDPQSYDLGYKEAPVFVQNDVISYIEENLIEDKTSKVAVGESMQIIYNFQEDRIILGTTAVVHHMPGTVVVGEYRDGQVILNQGSHQWLNTTYFKKLWMHSYPTYPLLGVHLRHEDGPKKVGAYGPLKEWAIDKPEGWYCKCGQGPWSNLNLLNEHLKAVHKVGVSWTDEPEDLFLPPQKIRDVALEKMECLHCGSHLLQEKGAIWCPGCGWTPKTAAGTSTSWVEVEPADANGYAVLYDPDANHAYIGTPYAHHYQVWEKLYNEGIEPDAGYWEGAYVNGQWYWYHDIASVLPYEDLDDVAKAVVDEIRREPHLAKTAAPFDNETDRGTMHYIEAFMDIQGHLYLGGSEHYKLAEQFVDDWVAESNDPPDQAHAEAFVLLETAIAGHIGEEGIWSDDYDQTLWAVFSSDALNQTIDSVDKELVLEALQKQYPGIKEGDKYVYESRWYQGDG